MSRKVIGIIYLIHFEQKVAGHAGHYLGFVEGNLARRIGEHRTGQGSKLMAEVKRLGIDWRLVRTWRGDRYFERKLKKRHGNRLCPTCSPNYGGQYARENVTNEVMDDVPEPHRQCG